MNIKAKLHPMTVLDTEAKLSGLGANVLWSGPFDSTGYPKGKGSSSGSKGVKLRFADVPYSPGAITQKAKGRF